jgi:hypothetical protein
MSKHTHTDTHRCYDVGMPKNVMSSNKIKWPQLVGDRHTENTHNDTQNNYVNLECTLKLFLSLFLED